MLEDLVKKNIELLIQAYKNFKSDFNKDNLQLIIGDGPKLEEYIAKQRKNKKYNINFLVKEIKKKFLKL